MRLAAPRALAPLALMGLIFWLSSQTGGGDIGEAARIAAHAGQFGLLAALWAWALGPAIGRRAIAAAAVISLLYAVSDEYHQSFVPGRDADPFDVGVDAAGVALALGAIILAVRDRR